MSTIVGQVPLLNRAKEQAGFCVSAITAGDTLVFDSAVSITYDYTGVKTAPATADLSLVGIALETVTGSAAGTSPGPQRVRFASGRGYVLKAKMETNVVVGDPLVQNNVAGELIKNVNTNISAPIGHAITAEGVLIDGTVAAGFGSLWMY